MDLTIKSLETISQLSKICEGFGFDWTSEGSVCPFYEPLIATCIRVKCNIKKCLGKNKKTWPEDN